MTFFLPSNHVPQLMLSSLNPTLKAILTLILLLHFARAYGRASGLVILVPGHTRFTLIYAQPTYTQISLNKTFWPLYNGNYWTEWSVILVWNRMRDFKIEQARSASSIWNHKYDFRPKVHDPKFNCQFVSSIFKLHNLIAIFAKQGFFVFHFPAKWLVKKP